ATGGALRGQASLPSEPRPVYRAARPGRALPPPPRGPTMTLDQTVLADLTSRLRGPVLAPGDAGYDSARSVWNAMIDRRPGAIARCLGAADVVAAVRFARERGLPLSVKCGGHNIAGLAVADDALTLDLGLMR